MTAMMQEQTFKLDELTIRFLESCQDYGFQDPSEVVRTALAKLQIALNDPGPPFLSFLRGVRGDPVPPFLSLSLLTYFLT